MKDDSILWSTKFLKAFFSSKIVIVEILQSEIRFLHWVCSLGQHLPDMQETSHLIPNT